LQRENDDGFVGKAMMKNENQMEGTAGKSSCPLSGAGIEAPSRTATKKTERPDFSNVACRGSKNRTTFIQSILSKRVIPIRMEQGQNTQLRVAAVSAPEKEGVKKWP